MKEEILSMFVAKKEVKKISTDLPTQQFCHGYKLSVLFDKLNAVSEWRRLILGHIKRVRLFHVEIYFFLILLYLSL